jgi:large subunit ribosomal protein L22
MAQATASLTNYRQSPRKVRIIADLVRGKSVDRALALLMTLPKRGSEPMEKLVRSAIANAVQQGATASDLVIEKIEVNGGIVFKRSMPRARGRASAIRKKSSHITLALGLKSGTAKVKKSVVAKSATETK